MAGSGADRTGSKKQLLDIAALLDGEL